MGSEDKIKGIKAYLIEADEDFINCVYDMVQVAYGKKKPISVEEYQAIDQGIRSLDEGNGIPHKEVMDRLKAKYPQVYKK